MSTTITVTCARLAVSKAPGIWSRLILEGVRDLSRGRAKLLSEDVMGVFMGWTDRWQSSFSRLQASQGKPLRYSSLSLGLDPKSLSVHYKSRSPIIEYSSPAESRLSRVSAHSSCMADPLLIRLLTSTIRCELRIFVGG